MSAYRTTATAFLAAAVLAMTAPAFAAGGSDRGQNLNNYQWGQVQQGSRNGSADRTSQAPRTDHRVADNRYRGNYRWDDGDDWKKNKKGYKPGNRGWHYGHNTHYRRWVGHPVPRGRYVVVNNYTYYGLPAPRPGYYYVRQDNDVLLVAQATKLVIDAFVLLNAASH